MSYRQAVVFIHRRSAMFFIGIFGVDQAKKEMAVQNNTTCVSCGRLTRYHIFKTYSYFHIFFIPTFRWNVKYFVQADCCGMISELDPEIGRRFAAGESHSIQPEHLFSFGGQQRSQSRTCHQCGRSFDPDFQYCPYCGKPFQ